MRRRWAALGAAVMMAATTTACGTRRPLEEIAATHGAGPQGPPGAEPGLTAGSYQSEGMSGTGGSADGRGTTETDAGGDSARSGSPGSVPTTSRSTGPAAGQGRASGASRGSGAGAGAGSAGAGGGAAAGAGSPGAASPGPAPSAASVVAGSPIKIASVGTYSGIVGQNVAPGVKGLQAWVAIVNERGGLAGHPVDLVVADDGGDPARHASLVQQMVEQRGVVAFVHNGAPLGGQTSVEYLTRKRIPVLGSEMVSDWFYSSPMFFPQGSSGLLVTDAIVGNAADQLKPEGKRKVGVLVCSEGIDICEQVYSGAPRAAERFGLDIVYRAKASLAQPDFTGECLNAQRAGVEMIVASMDGNSLIRMGRSCASIGYQPTLAVAQNIVYSQQVSDPGFQGAVVVSMVAPWTVATIPGVAAFQTAMRRFAPSVEPSGAALAGWVAGKMLERVAAGGLPAEVTSETILRGLWTFKDETLDGTTAPLTFVADQPAPRRLCYGHLRIENNELISPDGGKMVCP